MKPEIDENRREILEDLLKGSRDTLGRIAMGDRAYETTVTVTLDVAALAKDEEDFVRVI